MLEDLDEKADGGEDLGVGLEEVRIGRAIHDGVRASLVDEEVSQRDGCAHDVLRQRFPSLGGAGGNADGGVHGKPAVCPAPHVFGPPLVQELALREEGDHSLTEAAAHLLQIDPWDVVEPAFVSSRAIILNGPGFFL